MDDIDKILMEGSVFKKQSESKQEQSGKVKTKAKRTSYTKGAHGSGSAKMKAEYKRRKQTRYKSN